MCGREGGRGYHSVSGRKWWSSGAGDPRAAVAVFMGRVVGRSGADKKPARGVAGHTARASHARQSMLLVPVDAPGVQVGRLWAALLRALPVLGCARVRPRVSPAEESMGVRDAAV